ncbi:Chloroplast-targeted copper chaperone protein [Striga hermonthica]|uniref:Chloroplast-targeted copper chaperone protein n=1 Tax=Striga hermonthica TaxID=68872 RepID=A0A9N7MQJ8_STRHE|nr:Chloroplast-targeted copper chaperone protein [Striga hermonthica]
MKSIDLFCASPASTAICSSMDHRAVAGPVDRQEARAKNRTNAAPCSSSDRPSLDKPRKSFSHKSAKQLLRRKSSADVEDLVRLRASSRYLLSDDQSFLDSTQALLPMMGNNYKPFNSDGFRGLRSEYPAFKISPAGGLAGKMCDHVKDHDLHKNPSNTQVVELRVSIHCKGCEGKLRKYISRMEGVTSFSIDLATKKVTVTGDVNPLGVLKSISKVKNAQFWASSASSSSSSSTSSPRVGLTR